MIIFSSALVLSDDPLDETNGNNPVVGWRNIVGSATLTADTENADFPAVNLRNPNTDQLWKGANAGEQSLKIETPIGAGEVDYIGLAVHNFGSKSFPVRADGATQVDPTQRVLFHFDSSTTADAAAGVSVAHTWTANDTPTIDGAVFAIGTGSAFFSGGGGGNADFISTPDHADYTLGAGDFTVRGKARAASTGVQRRIAGHTDATITAAGSAWEVNLTAGAVVQARVFVGAVTHTVTGTTVMGTTAFFDWELVRTGNILRLFVNGLQEGGDVAIAGSVNDCAGVLSIGTANNAANGLWHGWIDELALYVGKALHTAAFVPHNNAIDEWDWVALTTETIPADDRPLLFRLVPELYAALRIHLGPGLAAPEAAVLYVGKLLIMQRRLYVGHTPITMGRSVNAVSGTSEDGNFLGRIVLGQFNGSTASFQNLRPDWYRENMEPFVVAAIEIPFFFAWRPLAYPTEVGFAWFPRGTVPKPRNQRRNGMMAVDLPMTGIV